MRLGPPRRPKNPRFLLWTAAAGLITFAGSGFLTLLIKEARVSQLPPGAQTTDSSGYGRLPAGSPSGALPSSGSSSVATTIALTAAAERLRGTVTHNPFAPLQGPAPLPGGSDAPAIAKTATPAKIAPVAVVAPPPPPPAPPPMAPPLPFTAVGAIQGAQVTEGKPVAFIRQQDQLIVVRPGDAVGPNYKVESISAKAIELTYLPLMQRQSLALTP